MANLRMLIRALQREPLDQILRNLRRQLARNLPNNISGTTDQPDLYQAFLAREIKSPLAEQVKTELPDWVFPHTDAYQLAPHAKAAVAAFVQVNPTVDIIYCDEDQIDKAGNRHSPIFKPGWSPERLLAYNYIGQPLAVRRDLLPEGEVDFWKFLLEASSQKQAIAHLPKVLMHKTQIQTQVQIQTQIQTPDTGPLVSILIPSKNQHKLLKACLDSLEKTTYTNYEILVLDNASDHPKTCAYLKTLQGKKKTQVIRIPNKGAQFSFSYINNTGVKSARGELLLFLNDDTEVQNPAWLSQMVGYHSLEGVGIVGAKLLYPNQTLQHIGVGIGMFTGNFDGFPVHYFAERKADDPQLVEHTQVSANVMAVTGACCLISKSLFEALGGFDEELFPLTFNDIDLCLKAQQAGKRIVMAHEAVLIHKESKSRKGLPEHREMIHFKRKYRGLKDAYYNPNLSLVEHFSIRPTGAPLPNEIVKNENPDVLMEDLSPFCVITSSHRMRRHIERTIGTVPVEVVKMAVRPEDIEISDPAWNRETARTQLGFGKNTKVILHRDEGTGKKELEIIEYALKRLKKKAETPFELLRLPNEKITEKEAFAIADIFVRTAMHSDNMRYVLLAMQAGLPVVSHVDMGVEEYVLEGQNAILVPTGDLKFLVKAIQEAASKAVEFGQLSRRIIELNPTFAEREQKIKNLMIKAILLKQQGKSVDS